MKFSYFDNKSFLSLYCVLKLEEKKRVWVAKAVFILQKKQ